MNSFTRTSATYLTAILFLFLISGCDKEEDQDEAKETKPTPAPKVDSKQTTPSLANPEAGKCPVSGDPIDPEVTIVHDKKTYGFCCGDCQAQFKEQPGKFIVPKPAPTEKKPSIRLEGTEVTFGKRTKHTILLPKGWKKEKPSNNMRIFQAAIPIHKNDKEGSSLSIFQMQGVDFDGNVRRLAGQFGGMDSYKGKQALKTNENLEATLIEFSGTFTPPAFMNAGGPKKNHILLEILVSGPDQKSTIFKILGPRHTIEANRDRFIAMVKSFKK